MKIEIMENIVNSIPNIDICKKVLETYDKLDDRIKEKLERSNYDFNIISIVTSSYVLENRTVDEQLKLIQQVNEDNKKVCENLMLDIATNKNVLKNRTPEEQIRLMRVFKDCDGPDIKEDMEVFRIIMSSNILRKRTYEEQLKLIQLLIKSGYHHMVFSIIVNSTVLANRTFEEQLKLIQSLKEFYYDETAFNIAINQEILEGRTVEEQIEIMRDNSISIHSDNLNKIDNISELKEYIEFLKRNLGPEQDVSLEESVPIYKKQK